MDKKSLMIIGVVVLIAIVFYNSRIDLGPFPDRGSGFPGPPGVDSVPSFKECLTAFGCDIDGCETERFAPLSQEYIWECVSNNLRDFIIIAPIILACVDGDDDCDGVPNEYDICEGSDDNVDTDGDGVPDGCDLCPETPPEGEADEYGCSENQEVPVNPETCEGDVNGDGNVNIYDLLLLLANWGPCDGSPCQGDLNGDGVVDLDDLEILIANWGPCGGAVPPIPQ